VQRQRFHAIYEEQIGGTGQHGPAMANTPDHRTEPEASGQGGQTVIKT